MGLCFSDGGVGRVEEAEGTGHSPWVITPADTGSEGRCPMVGGVHLDLRREETWK